MKILFVCLGNTCRSPMAESVMKEKLKECRLDWFVDSAGLRTWNAGTKPSNLGLQVLKENNLSSDHVGRMVTEDDFYNFDYILGMDEQNIKELKELEAKAAAARESKPTAKIQLLGSYIGRKEDEIIRDPYYSNDICIFRHVFVQISESCSKFIKAHLK